MHETRTPDPDTFAALWETTVAAHGARVFLTFRDATHPDATWTYAAFDRAVRTFADRLRAHGVGRGDTVHLCLANSPVFVAAWLATSRLGACMVPVDPSSGRTELGTQIARTSAALTVTTTDRATELGADLPDHPVLVVTGDAADLGPGGVADASPATAAEAPAEIGPDDRIAIMFTSGTTSQPKGVVLTQANYAYTARTMAELAGLRPEHRWLVVLPLFHGNAQFYCFASAIAVGASVALTHAFSASGWAAQARELAATHASLFAAPIRMILARTPEGTAPLSLTHVWFAQNLSQGHHARFGALCGVHPRQLYGMTETTAVATAQSPERAGPDTIGPAVPGRRIDLVDPATGEPTAEGPGVIVVHGVRGRDLFLEYMDAPEINARVFGRAEDGTGEEGAGHDTFSTGDLARRDAAGVFTFVGRVDDVVKVSGENVSLTEVEAALAEAPGVLEVAVVAEPDPVRDVVPHAFVVPQDPAEPPSVATLEAFAAARLPKASRPRHWTTVGSLPRTSVGKIRRFQLQKPTT
ncbi:class I adenylate-forming enzyme family protein [Brevibacterium litoralis]|uniref:class I adenylate-forming enzyme family protein n=1 Tax=Brevibacterium litoralis TaxID=3138935 RepID=UPI0032EE995D